MKSVHFKKSNDERLAVLKKNKASKQEKKIRNEVKVETKLSEGEVAAPEYSDWIPSRDWHKYLSGQENDFVTKESWRDCVSKNEQNTGNCEDFMLTKPDDKLIDIKLPAVNFCSDEKNLSPQIEHMNISDLGDGDKGRLAQLIQELARCKQEKRDDEETILMLKNKVSELKTSMRKLLSQRNSECKTISKIRSQNEVEQLALKNQLSELNQLIYQLQVQKATTEVQLKTIVVQAERMTKVIHEMHRENTELQVELRLTKDRLSVAQNAVDKVTKDLQEVQRHLTSKPEMLDKGCQSVEDLGSGDVKTGKNQTTDNTPDDQRILHELFFNKSLQSDFAPKETVIILPSDSFQLLSSNQKSFD